MVAAVHEISMRANDLIAQALAGHRLTPATFQAPWVIDPGEAPPAMEAVAERLHCNAPNLTSIADQLVDRGLVERAVDPVDRRSRVLLLTVEGRRVREELVRTALETTPQQLASLLGRAVRTG